MRTTRLKEQAGRHRADLIVAAAMVAWFALAMLGPGWLLPALLLDDPEPTVAVGGEGEGFRPASSEDYAQALSVRQEQLRQSKRAMGSTP